MEPPVGFPRWDIARNGPRPSAGGHVERAWHLSCQSPRGAGVVAPPISPRPRQGFGRRRHRPASVALAVEQRVSGGAESKKNTRLARARLESSRCDPTTRAHHRHHRPGRQLPGRVAARARATRSSAWCAAPARRTSSASRTCRTGSSCARPTCSTSSRSSTLLARRRARRGLQPGGPVLRADQLEAAGADRRVHRPRRDPHAGGDPDA